MTAVELVNTLRERNVILRVAGNCIDYRAPAGVMTPDLRQKLVDYKPAILVYLQAQERTAGEHSSSTAQATAELHRAIQAAESWQDLDQLLQQAQSAFEAGHIDQQQAEEVAAQAAERSRQLPERREDAGELRLSELFREDPICRVYSHILGEELVFAADDAEVPADDELVVYRESELRALASHPPAEVQRIHLVKVVFDGELVA